MVACISGTLHCCIAQTLIKLVHDKSCSAFIMEYSIKNKKTLSGDRIFKSCVNLKWVFVCLTHSLTRLLTYSLSLADHVYGCKCKVKKSI